MSAPKPLKILFEGGHNEELTLEEPELALLAQLLEVNGFAPLTKATSLSADELSQYQVVVVGNPFESKLSSDEITALVSFVESGRGLLLVSGATIFGKGGDIARSTNLNDLAKQFGFEFSNKSLLKAPEVEEDLFHAVPTGNHQILEGIGPLILTSGTTLVAEDADTHLFRVPKSQGTPTIAIATNFKKGRIAAFGGGTFFFNDYIASGDHEKFIVQLFRWLASEPINLPVQKVASPVVIMDEVTAAEAIEELRQQLDKIEDELSSLKEVINSGIKEMEKMVREIQDKDKDP